MHMSCTGVAISRGEVEGSANDGSNQSVMHACIGGIGGRGGIVCIGGRKCIVCIVRIVCIVCISSRK